MMRLTSTSFVEGARIPPQHTCEGKNVSPALAWTGLPATTQSLVLIMDDPDASGGTWVHWVVYDLPAGAAGFAEDTPRSQYLPGGARQGLNDFRHLGYGGPCPPRGQPHRYFFKLYALDTRLELPPGATKATVETAMQAHILDSVQLVGLYQRSH